MDKLIISETDRGRYAVRPMNWAGIWNEKGQIKESLNHLALFIEKEDAEKFVEWKEAEEQNRLIKLPCAVGDTVYIVKGGEVLRNYVVQIHITQVEAQTFFSCYDDCFGIEQIGKTVFLTREEAEAALKKKYEYLTR